VLRHRLTVKQHCHALWKLDRLNEHLDGNVTTPADLDLKNLPGEYAAHEDTTGHHRQLTVEYLRTQVWPALSAENLNVHVANVIRTSGNQHGVLARHSVRIAALPVRDIRRLGILSNHPPVRDPHHRCRT
jgi:hypothetical protein